MIDERLAARTRVPACGHRLANMCLYLRGHDGRSCWIGPPESGLPCRNHRILQMKLSAYTVHDLCMDRDSRHAVFSARLLLAMQMPFERSAIDRDHGLNRSFC